MCGCSPPSSPSSRAAPAPPAPSRSGPAPRPGARAIRWCSPLRPARPRPRRTGRTDEALLLLAEARAHLLAGARPTAADLEAAGLAGLTAAQAHRPALARDFAARAEEDTLRLARHPHTPGRPRELTAGQCALYGIGIHHHLGDVDTALAHARRLRPDLLLTAERRARAATDTARVLLDAGDAAGAFAQLRLVEAAAPLEARRPAVRALTAHVAGVRPGLPALGGFVARTVVSPG
ncbi:transcriptional regulator [Streptomyces sp. NPDC088768]|uniref:transcriptional regulator n=1 Tax=Streptomyces sp. NPDC088768 TaxID=3365894 RepID=UPI00382DCC53